MSSKSDQAKVVGVIGSWSCSVEPLSDSASKALWCFPIPPLTLCLHWWDQGLWGVEGNHVHAIVIEPQLAPGAMHVPEGQSGSKMHRAGAVCYCMAVALANICHLRVAVCMHVG